MRREAGRGHGSAAATYCTKFAALALACALLGMPLAARAGEPPQGKPPSKPIANSPDEPLAATLSLAKSADYLDGVTLSWLRDRKCASCHTGYPYLMARPALGDAGTVAVRQVRQFFEERVAAWDRGGKGSGLLKGDRVTKDTEGVTEVVAVAATLACHDGQSTGKLHPRTRLALDRMWELQLPDGSWAWNKTQLAPQEHDDYFGVVFAALGVGHAPEGYARGEAAQAGVALLRRYLHEHPPPDLHHKTWLVWASLKLDDLMTPAEREKAIKELLALQQADGGWSLPSLGRWWRLNGWPNSRLAPSDGYATGLAVYVLRQAGVAATEEPIQRGVRWLKANQRASGRWFTRSLNADRAHYISNAGTAYAVMALTACGVTDK